MLKIPLSRFIKVSASTTSRNFASDATNIIDMEFLRENSKCFVEHSFALYATDVMSQQAGRPSGNMIKAKPYFGGKHNQHGFKSEAPALSIGIYIYLSGHEKKEEADISIFHRCLQKYKIDTKKAGWKLNLCDIEDSSANHRAILADKEYQGLPSDTRIGIPIKNPPHGSLSYSEKKANRNIGKVRVFVEHVFGR